MDEVEVGWQWMGYAYSNNSMFEMWHNSFTGEWEYSVVKTEEVGCDVDSM